jgi:uncharacterized protein with PQ loop repeat
MIGWIGAVLLASAGVPQTFKVWREGHARGMSWWYIGLLWTGFLCMDVHSARQHAGAPLIVSYSIQLALFLAMAVRKAFPRKLP